MSNEITKPTISFKNIIRFPRLKSQNVIGYRITVKEILDNGTVAKYNLPDVDNPIYPNPILSSKKAEYKGLDIQLEKDTYYDIDHIIELKCGNKVIGTRYFTFNSKYNLLKINKECPDIADGSILTIKYYRDLIEVENKTLNKCSFNVQPILDKTYRLGKHSILR